MNIYDKLPLDLKIEIEEICLLEHKKNFNICLNELKFLIFIDQILKDLFLNYKYEIFKYSVLTKDNKKVFLSYNQDYIFVIKNNNKKLFYINLDKYNIFNIRKHKELMYYLYNLFKQKFKLDSFQ